MEIIWMVDLRQRGETGNDDFNVMALGTTEKKAVELIRANVKEGNICDGFHWWAVYPLLVDTSMPWSSLNDNYPRYFDAEGVELEKQPS